MKRKQGEGTEVNGRVIDNHCHYQKQADYLERMLSGAQEAGVDVVCLNGGGPRWNQHGNNEVLAAAQKYPDRIVPVAFCYLGEHTAADVHAWFRAGFRALKTQCPASFYDDDAFFPIYAAAEECRMPILFHTGISARMPQHDRWDTSSRYMMPLTLDRIARCFPDLVIWGAHLGVPDTWHAAMLMMCHPRVYFDLCGTDTTEKRQPSLCNFGELFVHGERQWGKLVFGSEGSPQGFGPLLHNYISLFEKYQVSEAMRQRILWDNVAEALNLENL